MRIIVSVHSVRCFAAEVGHIIDVRLDRRVHHEVPEVQEEGLVAFGRIGCVLLDEPTRNLRHGVSQVRVFVSSSARPIGIRHILDSYAGERSEVAGVDPCFYKKLTLKAAIHRRAGGSSVGVADVPFANMPGPVAMLFLQVISKCGDVRIKSVGRFRELQRLAGIGNVIRCGNAAGVTVVESRGVLACHEARSRW